MPAPLIRVVRERVIERIVIDLSVVAIEAVVAGIGAPIAPIVTVPTGPDMTLADDRPEIRGYRRSAGAAKNGTAKCSRNKMPFHDDAQAQ